MIRAGLARAPAGVAELEPPFGPGKQYPELPDWVDADGPPNPVYAAVRDALHALGLDAGRFGSEQWNPLGALAPRGGRVVLKPNWIRHWNPAEARGGSLASVVTHGSVVRAIADYAFLAVGPEGSVAVAEAPQMDCDFARVAAATGVDAVAAAYDEAGLELPLIDLRREAVRFEGGVVVERRKLPGDPAGYRAVDLGARSFFHESGLDAKRFRGADYDPGPTTEHHTEGRHEYLISETVLQADLLVNLPKLKTHKKTGVTLALKNLVGVNGDKNWLPHHTAGAVADGGDEFPGSGLADRVRSAAIEALRPLLARGFGTGAVRAARRVENAVRGDAFARSGNWHGNQTTWRMCCDLNRCVYFSDADGPRLHAPAPVRHVLTLIDGLVAGEGDGPLAPTDVPLGVLIAATDPLAADLVAVRLMGFDALRIPKLARAMSAERPRFSAVRTPEDVVVCETLGERVRESALHALPIAHRFRPHPGWVGALESSQ